MNLNQLFIRLWLVFVVAWAIIFGLRYHDAQNARKVAYGAVGAATLAHAIFSNDPKLKGSFLDQGATPEQEELAASTKETEDEALTLLVGGLTVGSAVIAALYWVVKGSQSKS